MRKGKKIPCFNCITTRTLFPSPGALQMHQVECGLTTFFSFLLLALKNLLSMLLPLFRIFTPKEFYIFSFLHFMTFEGSFTPFQHLTDYIFIFIFIS